MQIIYAEYALAQWSVTQRNTDFVHLEYPGFGSDFFFWQENRKELAELIDDIKRRIIGDDN